MNIILEGYDLASSNRIEIRETVEVTLSIQEALRQCRIWLAENMAMSFMPSDPTLIVRDTPFWRMKVMFTANSVGAVGQVGEIEIDGMTGEIDCTQEEIDAMFAAAQELAKTLPPYKPRTLLADSPYRAEIVTA